MSAIRGRLDPLEIIKMINELTEDDLRFVKMCKALGNPVRFMMVKELKHCQPCICGNIVALTPLAQSTVSQHLKVLREARLVQIYEDGSSVYYSLDQGGLHWFIQSVADLHSTIFGLSPMDSCPIKNSPT